ncbi:hypothetical protein HBB16_18385 [Pseudonocardia sp. MCCB 268]|nr:hypothetical protein [Pseudonocardia cytotoxica]
MPACAESTQVADTLVPRSGCTSSAPSWAASINRAPGQGLVVDASTSSAASRQRRPTGRPRQRRPHRCCIDSVCSRLFNLSNG